MDTISPTPLNLLERFNRWIQESIMIKLFSIGFLILILLIPSAWIEDLIYERQQRAEQVVDEIADKWSGPQILSGPILVIPFKKQEIIDRGKDGKEIREHVSKAFFLPETLAVNGTVDAQELHRGIFDAAVYESTLQFNANFGQPEFQKLGIDNKNVLWQDAHIVFGISDLRGISQTPEMMFNNESLATEPSNNIGISISQFNKAKAEEYRYSSTEAQEVTFVNGIVSKVNWTDAMSSSSVNFKLNLKGSKRLDFVPTGKITEVKLTGPWKDPSFDGEFLPEHRQVDGNGFAANWKVLHYNRPFSQQWIGDGQALKGADFGVKLLIPVDQYQKSIRTSKYGVLIILLTFIALFLVEITQKIRIHPFQYILIGAALIIYYTLLLSFSEHIGYNAAYIISSIATVVLISLYATTFFKRKLVILFGALLIVFYAFIFIIILQQDFSLLLGSIGLFMIIGSLMYFSRKVNWYKETPVVQ